MKKILLLILSAFSLTVNAQPYYFSQTTSSYSDLTGATTLTSNAPWFYSSAFTVPLGFNFNYMGTSYTSVNVEGSGFAFFDVSYYHIALPFCVKLIAKGSSGANSPISYVVTGVAPNRICKVQWKNAGFHFDSTSTINFQMWFYESSNIIESRIGASSINSPSQVYQENGSPGPVIGVYEYTSGSNCLYSNCLSGNPAAPTVNNPTGTIFMFMTSLNGTPASGTVYRFDPNPNAIESHAFNSFTLSNITGEYVTITASAPVLACTLYSIDGKTSVQRRPDGNQLFIGDLPVGMYILEAQIEGVISRQKLIISH